MNIYILIFLNTWYYVNHDHKLKNFYSIDGRLLKFIANYLNDREQCVVLDDTTSSFKHAISGVPQGFILGPILFVLFISDIPNGLISNTKSILYADDTIIWRSIKIEFDISELQRDINYLHIILGH